VVVFIYEFVDQVAGSAWLALFRVIPVEFQVAADVHLGLSPHSCALPRGFRVEHHLRDQLELVGRAGHAQTLKHPQSDRTPLTQPQVQGLALLRHRD